MNGSGFDWFSGLVGFVVGAVAVGFLSKAGESLYKKIAEHFSPMPKPKPPPIRIKPDFSNAPEHIKEKRLHYNQEKYNQTWLQPSDRTKAEAAGFFPPLTNLGEEVSTIEDGQIKIWLVKEKWTIIEPDES